MDFGLTETMIKKIGWHLRHFPQVETAILFGSRGKGNFREDSDIDLALKGDGITDDGCNWFTLWVMNTGDV